MAISSTGSIGTTMGARPDAPSRAASTTALHLPLGLSLFCLLLALTGEGGREWLRFDRAGILADGQLWRLLTGHLVHLGWTHLAMNLAGLWLVWLLYGQSLATGRWLLLIVASSIGISSALLVLDPWLNWYVGLSGVLHALIVAGIVVQLRHRPLPGEWLLLGLIAAKLTWEQFHGALPGSAELAGGPVVVDAHLHGALIGVPAGLWLGRHTGRRDLRHSPSPSDEDPLR